MSKAVSCHPRKLGVPLGVSKWQGTEPVPLTDVKIRSAKSADAPYKLFDGGYAGKPFATGVTETLGAAVEIAKRNELHKFV